MSKRKKIILFYPKIAGPNRPTPRIPLALIAISKLLREKYDIIIVYDRLYEDTAQKILKECKDALCLGISVMTGYQIYDGLKVSELVKERYPNLPIIFGGWHPSLEPETTIASPYVDIIVRGQGERTFAELVDALDKKKPLNNIKGVSYKVDGKIFHNPDRESEDLNSFPRMPFELIEDMDKVLISDEYANRTVNYVSSYGCPYRCGFCAIQTVHKRSWNGLDAHRIVDEIEELIKRYKIDAVLFDDPNFFFDKERVRKFCTELIRRKLPIIWHDANGRIEEMLRFEDDMWELIEKSGCRSIEVGAESGWQKALDFMQKDLRVNKIVEFAEKCKKYNIKPICSFVMGLPWSSDYKKTQEMIDKEIKYTLEVMEKIVSINRRSRITPNVFTPYPGSPLYFKSLDIGLKAPSTLEGWSNWMIEKKTTPWILNRQARTIIMIKDYISFFLDIDSYERLRQLLRKKSSKLLVFFTLSIFDIFKKIAEFRWKHKFFSLPIDYWLFSFVKERESIFIGKL
jgi:radical SAM superfamily enzyme YgiQ (UPF0313 family)